MKLDDNTRSALHYLALGVVVLFLLMTADRVLSGFATSSDPRLQSLYPLQHGFLLGDAVNIVDTNSSRGERIAWALVVAVAGASITGLLVRWISRGRRSWVLGTARLMLLLLLGWGIYAALFVPVRAFAVRDATLVERRYSRLIGDLPLPFTGRSSLHTGPVTTRSIDDPDAPCGIRIDLQLADRTGERMASLHWRADRCVEKLTAFPAQADSIAALLNGYLQHP